MTVYRKPVLGWILVQCLVFSIVASAEPPDGLDVRPAGRVVDPGPLKAVEDAVLPVPLVAGPASHTDLPAYYLAANPEFAERLERARSHSAGGRRPYRAVTLVAGDAGIGKTFLKNEVLRSGEFGSGILKFDIRELYAQWLAEGKVELRPDLSCGEAVINRLMVVRDRSSQPVLEYLQNNPAELVLIDSLDELHPHDYLPVLRQIERFVFDSQRDFVHVVVFSRPCALIDYWSARAGRVNEDIELLLLHPPQFRTTGDLLVSSWNYATWKFAARHTGPDGEAEPLTLGQFARWSAADFVNSGEFRAISLTPNQELNAEVRDTLLSYVQQHRITLPMLVNLAGNAILREIVAQRVNQQLPYHEREIMDAYFAAWLERDYQSDGRPSFEHPQHLDLYIRMLEEVAVMVAGSDRLDKDGYFTVREADRVYVPGRAGLMSFSVQRILDRSGLKHIDPRATEQRKYRFEPIWLHRYLVERHNERFLRTAEGG